MNGTSISFVALKDHIENFLNHSTTGLVNPSKIEIGRTSKHILGQLDTELFSRLSLMKNWKDFEFL